MRKLILLVCMAALCLHYAPASAGDVIPSWENSSGDIGFFPICNEFSFYQNYDDLGDDRGQTLQIISINSFKFFTSFNFEFTADYNFDLTPGLDRDHYVELSLVKPVTSYFSLNVQRIYSTFESHSINQVGVRVSL